MPGAAHEDPCEEGGYSIGYKEGSAEGRGDALETRSQPDGPRSPALAEDVPTGPRGSCDLSLPTAWTRLPGLSPLQSLLCYGRVVSHCFDAYMPPVLGALQPISLTPEEKVSTFLEIKGQSQE